MFNPAPLTTSPLSGLLDIMITWNSDSRTTDQISVQTPGTTIISSLTKTANSVSIVFESLAVMTRQSYKKSIIINKESDYTQLEYADSGIYVLVDFDQLPTTAENIVIEPYLVLVDDDNEPLYTGTTDIKTGEGLNVYLSGSGITVTLTPPMLVVDTVADVVAFRRINGILPVNGDIQIQGISDTVVTVSNDI
jgi:hypothetical protein